MGRGGSCWLGGFGGKHTVACKPKPGQSGPSRQPFRNNVLLRRAWKLLQLAAFITHFPTFFYLEVGLILKTQQRQRKSLCRHAALPCSWHPCKWCMLAMHAGRPVLPVRDGENGPRQAAGSYKNSSIIQFWFILHLLFPASSCRLCCWKNILKLKIRKRISQNDSRVKA